MKTKHGLTLTEILIVLAIISAMAIAVVAGMDPIGAMAKGRDAQRKKDLNRIKTAFEEYFSDRNCFPNQNLVDQLILEANCKGNTFSPWLTSWPCDPSGSPYPVVIGDDENCPKWFKVMTNLENKRDTQIFDQGGIGTSLGIPVNYGVSSGNLSNTR